MSLGRIELPLKELKILGFTNLAINSLAQTGLNWQWLNYEFKAFPIKLYAKKKTGFEPV